MTGEILCLWQSQAGGGVIAKIEAARRAGVQKVIIPAENWLNIFDDFPDLKVIPVRDLDEVFSWAFLEQEAFTSTTDKPLPTINEPGLGVST